jgi:hypothetical protein
VEEADRSAVGDVSPGWEAASSYTGALPVQLHFAARLQARNAEWDHCHYSQGHELSCSIPSDLSQPAHTPACDELLTLLLSLETQSSETTPVLSYTLHVSDTANHAASAHHMYSLPLPLSEP